MKEPKTNRTPIDGDFANDLVDDPAASTAVGDDYVVDLVIPSRRRLQSRYSRSLATWELVVRSCCTKSCANG
jgi:hypothetical protein